MPNPSDQRGADIGQPEAGGGEEEGVKSLAEKAFPSRRSLLAAGGAAAFAALAANGVAAAGGGSGDSGAGADSGTGRAAGAESGAGNGPARTHGAVARLRDLEAEFGAEVGVFGRNLVTGRTVRYRAGEVFPICSVFKGLAAAAILRDLDRDGEYLARRIHYTRDDLVEHSPETGTDEHLANGMTVAELSKAAITLSDNTAGNLLLRQIGGPQGITRFCRSLGDRVTRLDRWETELNSAEPWRRTDITSPYSIARTYAHLLVGDALEPADSARLKDWMLANTTSGDRFRAHLPEGWRLADRTGGGSYAVNNDVGVAWTQDGTPIVLACLTRKSEQDAQTDNALIARAAKVLYEVLAG
ncbi:class A beta-lactamase [Streptomyces sp. NA04227]|nr:class A beta-lactamase [Streptomyces sp. NA04227]